VPPPVYERCRLAVRTASFALIGGRLERREKVINVVADSVERLAVPVDGTAAEVRRIEPPGERESDGETERDQVEPPSMEAAAGDRRVRRIAAVAPRPHSFGRRG
jgi:hypothetical protein